MDVHKRRPK